MLKEPMLFVTNLHFSKNGNGGQQRTYHLIKELSAYCDLVVLSPYNKTDTEVSSISATFIGNQGVQHLKYYRKTFFLRQIFKVVNAFLRTIGTKHTNTIHMAPSASYVLSKQIQKLKQLKKYRALETIVFDTLNTVVYLKKELFSNSILNAHNFDYELVLQQYNSLKESKAKDYKAKLNTTLKQLNQLKALEYNIDNYFNEIWVCSTEDKKKFKNANPSTSVTFYNLPNGSDTDKRTFQTAQHNYKQFLFVGSLNYAPNYKGLQWFVETIFKYLPKHFQLNIVGKSPDQINFKYVKDYDNINLIGEVKDISAAYANHDILLVPLLEGSGTRLKILEAMSYGKLVLSTAKGIEGINAFNGQHYLEFNTLAEFNALIPKFSNTSQLNEMRQHARHLVEESYSWKGIVEKYIKDKYGK
ncbi:glycosyltransferase [Winogradskyella sp. PG-2]|uniref:glycosyltransferase n=1 Tax=Winogradskyella sp. PG-2 TaxID=754409 RepID=UPI0004586546|nr:glycosyltransferase [Winogradskyella sp. PG-2]BAO76188.1 glycosyltransferase [Winogradskyella sp. PG-2]